jgi:hypothetical protein
MHVARFQLMALVGGHRSELIAEGIRVERKLAEDVARPIMTQG